MVISGFSNHPEWCGWWLATSGRMGGFATPNAQNKTIWNHYIVKIDSVWHFDVILYSCSFTDSLMYWGSRRHCETICHLCPTVSDLLLDLCHNKSQRPSPIPIGSMYGIYANIGGILMVNVTIYSIHGSYGVLPVVWDSMIARGFKSWLLVI
jgi:hypothetical protein